MNEDLINRITYYLSSGGLFNPELADHLAVRNLLMECRDALAQRTWVGLTDEEIRKAKHHMVEGAYHYSFKQGAEWAEAKLKEKNSA